MSSTSRLAVRIGRSTVGTRSSPATIPVSGSTTPSGAWFGFKFTSAQWSSVACDNADGGIGTDLDAIKLIDNSWYGVISTHKSAAEILALATWLARREEDRAGRNGDRIVDLALLATIFGVLGARLLSVLADGHFHDFVNLCTNPKLVPAIDAVMSVRHSY